MAGKTGHRSWGWLRPSGRQKIKRWHASYIGPDKARHKAPATFGAKIDAEGWLASERRLIDLRVWTPPAQRDAEKKAHTLTLAEYTPTWITERTVNGEPLRPRTRMQYERLFAEHIKPTSLAKIPLSSITTDAVRAWHATLLPDSPSYRAQAYGLVRAVLSTAVADGHIPFNPAQVRGASSVATKREPVILDVAEVGQLADAIDEELKALILISAWCGTRFGETTALQRRDVNPDCSVITVRRAVVHRAGRCIVDTPKNKKVRKVVVPPHIRPAIKHHLATHVVKGDPDALLFPGDRSCHLGAKTFRGRYLKALGTIGRDGKKKPIPSTHDLRHFAGTQTARVGNLVETMGRLGHSTAKASLTYQQQVSGRDAQIADALSALTETRRTEN